MKKITIDGKEYTITFSIAASLYNECTESIMDGFVKGGMIEDDLENKNTDGVLKNIISTIANIPQKACVLFYAGLMENHGAEYGDGSVPTLKDATKLLAKYLKEHKDENEGNGKSFYDVMSEMMEQIVEDHFFEMIGLDKMVDGLTEKKPKRSKKKVGEE